MYRRKQYNDSVKRDKHGSKILTQKERKIVKSIPARKPNAYMTPVPKVPAKRRKLISETVKKGEYYCPALHSKVE